MKKYTLIQIVHKSENSNFEGWKYNKERKMWEIFFNGKAHFAIAFDTKSIAEYYIKYNFKRGSKI